MAAYASRSRGCVCDPSQVIITSGERHAINLLALTLVGPGDAVALEKPGYPAARQAMAAYGARIHPIPVDEIGMRVEMLDAHADVRLVYVTPSNQYPTGVTLDLGRRLRLLEWARRSGALIVEDDYDGEFRYEGRPLQSLQGLDGGRSVAYVGTFSKSLAPGLRLGYLIVPSELAAPVARAKWLLDRQTPALPSRRWRRSSAVVGSSGICAGAASSSAGGGTRSWARSGGTSQAPSPGRPRRACS